MTSEADAIRSANQLVDACAGDLEMLRAAVQGVYLGAFAQAEAWTDELIRLRAERDQARIDRAAVLRTLRTRPSEGPVVYRVRSSDS